ncbi:MAG: DUF1461 domain-containing protein [Eubacteriales bacterium]|nr:DUF1461 domain-containing protein [Eubacteriales bacterium]
MEKRARRTGEAEAETRRQHSCALFVLCLLSGLVLTLCGLFGAVVYNALRPDLLKAGMETQVAAQGVIGVADADAFADETTAYLSGAKAEWEPVVTYGDHALLIPQDFRTHMARVRFWLVTAQTALPIAAAAGVLMLCLCAFAARRKRFSPAGYYMGAAVPLLAALGAVVWGLADFNGFWAWLHYTFILDGVFNAAEEIMRLFPETLFSGYIAPVCIAFGFALAVVAILPLLARRVFGAGRQVKG